VMSIRRVNQAQCPFPQGPTACLRRRGRHPRFPFPEGMYFLEL